MHDNPATISTDQLYIFHPEDFIRQNKINKRLIFLRFINPEKAIASSGKRSRLTD